MLLLKLTCFSMKSLAFITSYMITPFVLIGIWPVVVIAMADADPLFQAGITDAVIFATIFGNWLLYSSLRRAHAAVAQLIDAV